MDDVCIGRPCGCQGMWGSSSDCEYSERCLCQTHAGRHSVHRPDHHQAVFSLLCFAEGHGPGRCRVCWCQVGVSQSLCREDWPLWKNHAILVPYVLAYKSKKLLDEFLLRLTGSAYGSATPIRYYPSMVPVFLWPPLSCRHQSRPFSSSSCLHSGSSQRLATQKQ